MSFEWDGVGVGVCVSVVACACVTSFYHQGPGSYNIYIHIPIRVSEQVLVPPLLKTP